MVNSWTNQQPEKTYKRTNRVQIQRNFIIQRAFDGIMCNIDNCFNIHSKCFLVLNKLTSARILFETLAYSSARFQDTKRCFFPLQILLKKKITSIEEDVLRILAFLQKLSYFVFEKPWTPFFTSLLTKQLCYQANIPSINLVSKQIYHRIDGILLATSTALRYLTPFKPGLNLKS